MAAEEAQGVAFELLGAVGGGVLAHDAGAGALQVQVGVRVLF